MFFTKFNNNTLSRDNGLAYRHKILARGGSRYVHATNTLKYEIDDMNVTQTYSLWLVTAWIYSQTS